MIKRLWWVFMLTATGPAPAGDLDELLRQVQSARTQETRIDQERKARFLADKNQQQKLLNDTKAALAKAEAESKALRAEFAANEARLAELNAELKKRSGDLDGVFGATREFAGKLKADLDTSLISAQFPGRAEALAETREIPDIPRLENLWFSVLQEMTEAGKVVRFTGKITDEAGLERNAEVYRIGPFSALAAGKYLRYAPETGKLAVAPQQPESEFLSLARRLGSGQDKLVKVAVDPSRGAAPGLNGRASTTYPWLPKSLRGVLTNGVDLFVFGILLLASIWALTVACERWLFYRRVDFSLYPNREALETELSRHLTVIGTVAANAPYVGLLGTVLGIMLTFHKLGMEKTMDVHSIMIGLSTALKATAIGLIVAIPCVVLSNLLQRRIRELVTAYELRHES